MSAFRGAWAGAVVVAAAATFFTLSQPAAAQDWKGMGRIEGRVVDADGKPIVGAELKLELVGRGAGATAKTDKNGRWALGGIAAGPLEHRHLGARIQDQQDLPRPALGNGATEAPGDVSWKRTLPPDRRRRCSPQ